MTPDYRGERPATNARVHHGFARQPDSAPFVGRSLPFVVENGAFRICLLPLSPGASWVGVTLADELVPTLGLLSSWLLSLARARPSKQQVFALRDGDKRAQQLIFGFLLVLSGANVALDNLPPWAGQRSRQMLPLYPRD